MWLSKKNSTFVNHDNIDLALHFRALESVIMRTGYLLSITDKTQFINYSIQRDISL